jgi:hypothetical protein
LSIAFGRAFVGKYNKRQHASTEKPLDSLPARLSVSEPGSFAEYTLLHRLPRILMDVRDLNDYPPEIVANLQALQVELSDGQVQPLVVEESDFAFWQQELRVWQGHTWHQLPWYFAETFFYRRILEAVHYFIPGRWQGRDPFNSAKRQALAQAISHITILLQAAPTTGGQQAAFQFWVLESLWGNRSDYSNQLALANAHHSVSAVTDRLLVDDSDIVWKTLQKGGIDRLDVVCDNAGPELVTDLAFADMILTQQTTKRVVFHLKAHPFYVSDAMIPDVEATIEALRTNPVKEVSSLGTRLDTWLHKGQLIYKTHPFWTTSRTLFQVPPDLWDDISLAQLILFKGDVNYRRLVDDRHWPPTTPLAQVLNQVPSDYVALRTIKSEVVCGLASGQAERASQLDPQWMVNGLWGLVEYVTRRRS